MEFLKIQAALGGANSLNFKFGSVYCYACAKRPCHGNCTLIIPTGRISAKAGHAVSERCCHNCPLREAL